MLYQPRVLRTLSSTKHSASSNNDVNRHVQYLAQIPFNSFVDSGFHGLSPQAAIARVLFFTWYWYCFWKVIKIYLHSILLYTEKPRIVKKSHSQRKYKYYNAQSQYHGCWLPVWASKPPYIPWQFWRIHAHKSYGSVWHHDIVLWCIKLIADLDVSHHTTIGSAKYQYSLMLSTEMLPGFTHFCDLFFHLFRWTCWKTGLRIFGRALFQSEARGCTLAMSRSRHNPAYTPFSYQYMYVNSPLSVHSKKY